MSSVPWSPTSDQLEAEGVKGTLFVHEVSTVQPGSGPSYLAAMEEQWRPVARDHGHHLVGMYQALMSDSTVVTMWATDIEDHLELLASDSSDRRVAGGPHRVLYELARGTPVTGSGDHARTPLVGRQLMLAGKVVAVTVAHRRRGADIPPCKRRESFRRDEHQELIGVSFDPKRAEISLRTYAESWLAAHRRVDGRTLAPRTKELYRYQLDRFILPKLGDRPMESCESSTSGWHSALADRSGPMQAAKAYRLFA